ncbi:hypothetical protein Tbd_2721 [Thiobacillus denitrificans ATCC 25259]|uniref:Uncharacterized protein n=1 Tax=Thiobacillus denitrificans (strain ATCC 25259 / T1) TaxID=292415 RepID=Q3SFD6_THIDA|nr:hypothetical protein Tbd_2721 [Thiobacillus denitrificans ATCC 25259]
MLAGARCRAATLPQGAMCGRSISRHKGARRRRLHGYNARLQVPTRLSAAEDKRETGAWLQAIMPVLPPQR